ncbi:MAG TPA: hypothetical protein VG917_00260 [Patescibacteria group bacterium]|nr:hypothetical protein [Patescibacteria group bacterium]
MLNKVLIALSICFFVFVIFEATYLFFYKSPQPANQIGSKSLSVSPTISNGSQPSKLVASNVSILTNLVAAGQKGALTSATMNLVYEGKILEIYTKQGDINGTNYELGLKVKGENGINYLLILPNDLKVLEVYVVENGAEHKAQFQDLQVGDNVKLEVIKNLTEPFVNGQNTEKMKIVKL